jgi:PAS domain S-box-containing protein
MQAQDAQQLQQENNALRQQLSALRSQLGQAEQNLRALKESEGRYRILSGASLVGVYVIAQDGKVVYINSQAATILGYTPEEIVGRHLLEFVVEDQRPVVEENVRKRLQGEVQSVRYLSRALHKSGSIVDLEILGSRAVFDSKPAIIGTVLDRTEERRAERALRASEGRFQAFMDNTPTLAFLKDPEGRLVYANAAFRQLMRDVPGGILGKTAHDLFPKEQADVLLAAVHDVLSTRHAVEVTYAITVPDQGARHLLVIDFPVEDPEGRTLVGGMAVDISEVKRAEQSLAAQRRLLQSILDGMGEGVAATNERGEFTIFNPAARRITGLGPMGSTPAEWTDRYGIFLPDRITPHPPEDLPLARAMRGESTDNIELFVRNPGTPHGVWMSVTGRPLVDEGGAPRGGVVVFHDTTERRATLEQLTRAEEKYRALVERLPVVSYISGIQPLGPTFYMSPQVRDLLGDDPNEWVSDQDMWRRRLHPEDRDRVVAELERTASTGERFVCEYRMLAKDGGVVWLHDEAVVVYDKEDKPVLFQGVLLDITERQSERGQRQQLQKLSKEMMMVQEAERRRIGLELHDEIGQILTGLKLRLSWEEGQSRDELERRLRAANQLVDDAIEHVRELSQNLRPAVLDDLGLLPALVSYFGRYTHQTGVRVIFEHRGIERQRFPSDVETAAYRIVQEALTNVARHARVESASVRAWADSSQLGVQVEDEGPGFDAVRALARGGTAGLAGMRERAALLRGQLTVDSAPGRGCRVTGELPTGDGAA